MIIILLILISIFCYCCHHYFVSTTYAVLVGFLQVDVSLEVAIIPSCHSVLTSRWKEYISCSTLQTLIFLLKSQRVLITSVYHIFQSFPCIISFNFHSSEEEGTSI